jgi:hypothetical protein
MVLSTRTIPVRGPSNHDHEQRGMRQQCPLAAQSGCAAVGCQNAAVMTLSWAKARREGLPRCWGRLEEPFLASSRRGENERWVTTR